jgi:hypothetical protein
MNGEFYANQDEVIDEFKRIGIKWKTPNQIGRGNLWRRPGGLKERY